MVTYLEVEGKYIQINNIEDAIKVKDVYEYQKEVENFAWKILNMRNLDRNIYNDIKKFNKTIIEIKLEDDFIPFWYYFISDVFKYLERKTSSVINLCDYEKSIEHHYIFLNTVKFYTLYFTPNYTRQHYEANNNIRENFKKNIEYLRHVFKLLKNNFK